MNHLYKVSEVKLSYRARSKPKERVQVKCPADCYKIFINHWEKGQLEHRESFKVLLLNQNGIVLGIYNVAEGGIADLQIDVRIILQAALLANASSLVLAHNHPSNNLTPSYGDKEMTKMIQEAALVMNINVFDHIIVCKGKYFSFADSGLLFERKIK